MAGYGGVVTLRLAFHGYTLTRVGSGGIEIPSIGRADVARDAARMTVDELAISLDALGGIVDEIEERLLALEYPSQLVLHPRNEET